MKIKTKSGFVIDVDDKKAADWEFVEALVDCESPDGSKRMIGTVNAIKILLGEKGAAALADHVKDENGVKNIGLMYSEFVEIMTLIGEKTKKSSSSQG